VLYEVNSVGHDTEEVLDASLLDCPHPSVAEFCRTLVKGVLANSEEIDKIISAFAPNWPIAQMALVDRNILRMAIFEIIMGHETPPKVAINEAVELAKVYGSDSSPKFVNGVLGSVMESLKQKTHS
jgi:N utilization substance protein B